MKNITSLDNNQIKSWLKLKTARGRKESGLFMIDGLREIEVAIAAKMEIKNIIFCSELIDLTKNSLKNYPNQIITEVSLTVFKKLSYKEKPDGWLAIVESKKHDINDLKTGKTPLVILLESVEKPGNIGAIIRTAYAAGVEAIIITNSQTDIYNPNIIRASEGLLFLVPLAITDNNSSLKWLKEKNIKILATTISGGKNYLKTNLKDAGAIILGSEANGLTDFWLENADEKIKINMKEGIDSLNVSVSAAIIVFEALRQRKQ